MNIISTIKKVLLTACLLTAMGTTQAFAMGPAEQKLIDLQAMCDVGDKGACHRAQMTRLQIACDHGDNHACREHELIAFHEHCNAGDRAACVRFGIILGEDRDRREEWRRNHPDLFWWDTH